MDFSITLGTGSQSLRLPRPDKSELAMTPLLDGKLACAILLKNLPLYLPRLIVEVGLMVYNIQAKLVRRKAFSMAAKYCFGSFLYFVAGSRHTA